MWNYKLKKTYIILILLFWFWFVWAHNPRIVRDQNNSIENPIVVQEPENSQAFYAELKWKSDFYKIVSDTGFLLYLSLTVPAISWSKQNYWMIVKDDLWNILTDINWTNLKRKGLYEKFAWDLYYQWPEFQKNVWFWVYYVQIYSPDNLWKYVLAVWKLEIWPFSEIWNTLKVLPQLKSYFFEKSLFTIFFNYIWLSLLFSFMIVGLLILIVYRAIKFFRAKI